MTCPMEHTDQEGIDEVPEQYQAFIQMLKNFLDSGKPGKGDSKGKKRKHEEVDADKEEKGEGVMQRRIKEDQSAEKKEEKGEAGDADGSDPEDDAGEECAEATVAVEDVYSALPARQEEASTQQEGARASLEFALVYEPVTCASQWA
eukprot:1984740-Amphidinium_carterae.1